MKIMFIVTFFSGAVKTQLELGSVAKTHVEESFYGNGPI